MPILAWAYLIGGVIVFTGITYFLVTGWRSLDGLIFLISMAVAGVSLAIMISTARLLGRKIAFFDNYISYRSWLGTPKVYRVEDVIDIRIVKVDPILASDWGMLVRLRRWEFEDNTTIYFADGQKLRIPKTAMPFSKVKRRIESKLGIKFDSTSTLKLPTDAQPRNTVATSRRRTRSKKRGSDN